MPVKLDHETPGIGVNIPKMFELPPPSLYMPQNRLETHLKNMPSSVFSSEMHRSPRRCRIVPSVSFVGGITTFFIGIYSVLLIFNSNKWPYNTWELMVTGVITSLSGVIIHRIHGTKDTYTYETITMKITQEHGLEVFYQFDGSNRFSYRIIILN